MRNGQDAWLILDNSIVDAGARHCRNDAEFSENPYHPELQRRHFLLWCTGWISQYCGARLSVVGIDFIDGFGDQLNGSVVGGRYQHDSRYKSGVDLAAGQTT